MKLLALLAEIPASVLEQLEDLLSDATNVSFGMAIVDTIPVILFMLGMGFIIKLAHGRLTPTMFALLCGGVFTSFFGGACKCLWKILCSFGVNFTPLTVSFNIYQSVGFCLIAIALVSLTVKDKQNFAVKSDNAVKVASSGVVALLLFAEITKVSLKAGFIWFIVMAIFTVIYLVCLSIMCFRRKMVWQGVLFLVSMVLMFIMAALGKKFEDPTSPFAKFNWIAQIVNILVQVCMALPAYFLSKRLPYLKTQYVVEQQ